MSEDILDIVARSDALMALASTSLIEHQELADAAPAVTVHRLVQAAMRSRLAAKAGAIGVLETLAGALAAAVPEGAYDMPSHWPACSQLLPMYSLSASTPPRPGEEWLICAGLRPHGRRPVCPRFT